jgi:hypothetical protein
MKNNLISVLAAVTLLIILNHSSSEAFSTDTYTEELIRSDISDALPGGRRITDYEAENVIILVIDGLRNEEAFDDPLHQYIPHIWNDMRPQGTIYTQFYLTNWPFTTSGHMSIVTGARSNLPLSIGSVSNNSREHNPTIFEAYRKVFGLPGNETWIISGKNQLSTCDYSIHPSWGDE